MCPRQELNPDQQLRRLLCYPLHHEDILFGFFKELSRMLYKKTPFVNLMMGAVFENAAPLTRNLSSKLLDYATHFQIRHPSSTLQNFLSSVCSRVIVRQTNYKEKGELGFYEGGVVLHLVFG